MGVQVPDKANVVVVFEGEEGQRVQYVDVV